MHRIENQQTLNTGTTLLFSDKESNYLNFNNFSFCKPVLEGIRNAGYTVPTPIQAQAMSSIIKGHDVIGLAQTGTGKTAAFVLPILNRLIHKQPGQIRALIIVPTRELAEQIYEATKTLGFQTSLRSTVVYGGVSINSQIQDLKQADIVVSCPGRLLDHISRQTIDLSGLEVLVLDEADQMFDMGFFPDICRILTHIPSKNRQTLLFSATMPKDIRRLADDILQNPVSIQIGDTEPAKTVGHTLFPVDNHLKAPLLIKLLNRDCTGSVLVFTRTKFRAKRLNEKLSRAGFQSTSLQGNLSQQKRQTAISGFRSGKFRIMVATDIAARGIDILNVSHVINYDMPATAEAYIHRIGRTGRAERSGEAFTLFTEEDAKMVKIINGVIGHSVEQRILDDFDYKLPSESTDRRPNPQAKRSQKANETGNSRYRTEYRSRERSKKGAFAWLSPRNNQLTDELSAP